MEPLVVYVFSHSGGYQHELERRLDEERVDRLPVRIEPFSWKARALKTMEVAKAYADRPLIFVDAWDTLLLGTKQEIVAAGLDSGITFAASKVCWPDMARYTDYNVKQSGQSLSAWRYVNSNPMAGMGRDIAEAMEWCWERWPIKGDSADTREPGGDVCERFYTHMYLDSPFDVRVDSACVMNQIFLCSTKGDLLVADKRIVNLRTGTQPIFLHLNGKIEIDVELFR